MNVKVSYAVRTGTAHQQMDIPCQDKVAVERTREVTCVALADGAGSCRSSDVGAQCVTGYVAGLFCQQFQVLWEMADLDLSRRLLEGCVQALSRLDPPLYELSSTLLFGAIHRDGRYLSGHLGDGVQILVSHGGPTVFSPPENGDYQNETFFLTGADAAQHLRLRRGQLTGSGALLLMSDGMAESLYQHETDTPAPACATIARWLKQGEETVVSRALEDNMEKIFSAHSTDDLSLAVMTWTEDDQ